MALRLMKSRRSAEDWGISEKEFELFRSLSTPQKIQDFLDKLPRNNEKKERTCASPRVALREKKAHCIEGACIAALALWIHGERPLLLDLKVAKPDEDHVVALYKQNGYWGAISKTAHPVLRFRDPIYRTVRELALSYFHEYFLPHVGTKSLLTYSRPFSLKRFGTEWVTREDGLWDIALALDESRHFSIVPEENRHLLRKASKIEVEAYELTEWPSSDPRT
ncbi:MAG: hypothetical protein WAU88_03755 [Candidatus Zixiibacteriota bacterium]